MASNAKSVEQTPLEQLTEMNERVGKTRKKSAKPRDPTAKIERFYRNQLKKLVAEMNRRIMEEVMPVVRGEKAEYQVKDSVPTKDAWADNVIASLEKVSQDLTEGAFASQFERLAQRTVSMAEADTTDAFLKSVNEATGVDMSNMLDQEGLAEYVQSATYQNSKLIKNLSNDYISGIQTAVLGGVRGGDAPSKIAKKIQEKTGVQRRKAELIARDQTSKLTGEITERRQKQAGIRYFRWVTSKDERVGDDHKRAARRDVGYGPGVYRWDKPPQEGVPGNSTRPNCRCTATPVFEWELPKQ